jgi:hypothetical protein
MLHFVFKCFVYFSLKNNICDIKKSIDYLLQKLLLNFYRFKFKKGCFPMT